ncbi:aryl-sulfate sulfotransferase [Acidobacteria bacterium AH-259-G07]|nr:aryl-sulfate sulfotransferase [Acidobacteria bacterium AH-259-G07]
MSVRHQDWIVKIDYRDGTGTGEIIWRLGKDGDFTMLSNDPWPWFSHQHDVEFDGSVLTLYDNGNPRIFETGGGGSRGQALLLNESARIAALVLNVEFPYVGWAMGSAQRLANGNYHFTTGVLRAHRVNCDIPLCGNSHSVEVLPNGTSSYGLFWLSAAYRSFRMKDLYTP